MTTIKTETNTTETNEAQNPRTPKPKFDAKAYHRKYYREKLKGDKYCKYCNKLLGSVQSIRKHEADNLMCKVKRLEDTLKQNNINIRYTTP